MTTAQETGTQAKPSFGKDDLEVLFENASRAADFLRTLSHETRLMILCYLSQGERSVSDLESFLSLRQPTVSQQLARLRTEGLVATRRDGKSVYYRLASPEAAQMIAVLYELFCKPGSKP